MVLADIQSGLNVFSEALTSQTYMNTFKPQSRDSLLSDGLGTRANSIWKMAQYIIAFYDKTNEPIDKYLIGWETLVKNYRNQILIIEVSKGNWQMYDSYCNLLGGNEYIQHFMADKKVQAKLLSSFTPKGNEPLQLVYFGAPGTSKSTTIKKIIGKASQHRITFHPDTDYSNFVGCYKHLSVDLIEQKPKYLSKEKLIEIFDKYKNDGQSYPGQRFGYDYWESLQNISTNGSTGDISEILGDKFADVNTGRALGKLHSNDINSSNEINYEFVPQVFISAYIEAWKKLSNVNEKEAKKEVFLVIEEINRGNCAQIFGDLFQLLDRDDFGFSDYSIEPDSDLRRYLAKAFRGTSLPENIKTGKVMQLPPNLYIWATMNTSDQSLFPIDSAFKRRWEWKYLPIKNDLKGHIIRVDEYHSYDWWQFLKAVNERIEKLTELEDKQLGYWFAKPNNGIEISAERFVSKVVFYLWNDVFKDYGSDSNSPFIVKQSDDKKVKLKFTSFFSPEGDAIPSVVTMFIEGLNVDNLEMKKNTAPQDEPNITENITSEPSAVQYSNTLQTEAPLQPLETIDNDSDNDDEEAEKEEKNQEQEGDNGQDFFNSLYN